MGEAAYPLAVRAQEVAPRARRSNYPQPFASRMSGRVKRVLGDLFGLSNFGVNLTVLEPGAVSALQHRHKLQDEFVYVLEGEIWLVAGREQQKLDAGMCAGFRAGGISHHLENRSAHPACYLEIGDRSKGDMAEYPADDLVAIAGPDGWKFTHKDGTPY